MRIGVDLMGGDTPPIDLFEGVLHSLEALNSEVEFIFFADALSIDSIRSRFDKDLSKSKRLRFFQAQEIIFMADAPLQAVRSKPLSSLVLGVQSLKKDEIDAFISCGNTGALVAASTLFLQKFPGIRRPALLALLPAKLGPVALIDVGGHVSFKAEHLVQFARMGASFQQVYRNISCPSIGILNIGTEPTKGTSELQKTWDFLDTHKSGKMRFVGNIEPAHLLDGEVDVLVTDGFTGNIILKTAEGVSAYILGSLSEEDRKSHPISQVEYPGAFICGVDGLVIKCHGNATAKALGRSVEAAVLFLKRDLIEKLKKSVVEE